MFRVSRRQSAIKRFKAELYKCVQFIQDPEQLRASVRHSRRRKLIKKRKPGEEEEEEEEEDAPFSLSLFRDTLRSTSCTSSTSSASAASHRGVLVKYENARI